MWFHRRRDPRIADELRFHRDRLIEDYMAAGIDPARGRASGFSGVGQRRLARRSSSRRPRALAGGCSGGTWATPSGACGEVPGFAAVAILSFALGIGANVAIFSLINAVILRSLPVRAPHQLVQITRLADGQPGPVSYPLFEYFRDNGQGRVRRFRASDGQRRG